MNYTQLITQVDRQNILIRVDDKIFDKFIIRGRKIFLKDNKAGEILIGQYRDLDRAAEVCDDIVNSCQRHAIQIVMPGD